jgi:hypothetical protein
MGEKELREKYGGKLDKAINRAIRAELPGGNEALDKLTDLAGPAWRSGWYTKNGKPTPEAQAYFEHQKNVVEPMEATIRRQWQVPPARAAKPRSNQRTTGRPRGGRAKPARKKR